MDISNMKRYKDIDRDSGIIRYKYGDNYIIVEFKTGDHRYYKYTSSKCGKYNIEKMKKKADKGDGLNEFINEKREVEYSIKE